jgi:hypothetical protein
MKKYTLLSLLVVALLFEGCAKIYYTPDSRSLAQSHQIIAIAPPTVSIAASKNITADAMIEQQKTESINFQREMYSWLLKRKMQGRILVEIQDVNITNAKLAEAGFINTQLLTPTEMCKILDVDAVMTSNYTLTKPMSTGAAVAMYVLAGFAGPTNQTGVDLAVHDYKTNKMIFDFNHKLGSTFGSAAGLVDELMRQASKKLPYYEGSY